MLTAIDFIKQCDGKVGEYFARRSVNQNGFMNLVISDGVKPSVLDELTEKFGQLVLPVQEYKAVGSVYHQLKGPFAEYQQYGVVGSELPQEKNDKKPRAPRDPSAAPRTATRELPITAKIRDLETKYHSEIQKLPSIKPDAAAMAVATAFRESGNVALAEQIEAAANAAAQQAETNVRKLGDELLSDCVKVLFEAFGAEKVNAFLANKKA